MNAAEKEQIRSVVETMQARGVPPDDWMLYGVKHGLLPAGSEKNLADRYELGCPNCRGAE